MFVQLKNTYLQILIIMKKNLLGVAVLAAGFLFAQPDANAQSISVGPKVGLNFSTVGYTDGDKKLIDESNEDKTTLTGLHFGVAANIGVNDMFSIQPELLYSQKGAKWEDSGNELSTTTNYLEIPVLAKFTFGSDDLKFFVNAGPYVGYMVSGKHKMVWDDEDISTDIEFDYPDQNDFFPDENRVKPNRLDLGLALGAGVGVQAGPGTFNIEARYGLGLTDISTYEKERPNEYPKSSNRNFGFSVGYMFPLGN